MTELSALLAAAFNNFDLAGKPLFINSFTIRTKTILSGDLFIICVTSQFSSLYERFCLRQEVGAFIQPRSIK
jgi:hypothetical protein